MTTSFVFSVICSTLRQTNVPADWFLKNSEANDGWEMMPEYKLCFLWIGNLATILPLIEMLTAGVITTSLVIK